MKKICKYISYNEATRSQTASYHGIDNTPNKRELDYMETVGQKIFDPLREWVGGPIKVESFFRCNELNKLIGGSRNSQHRFGQAIDIDDDFGNCSNGEMFYWISENLNFDQLLWEFGNEENPNWIHVSYVSPALNRKKVSIAYKNSSNRTKYEHFYGLGSFNERIKELYV